MHHSELMPDISKSETKSLAAYIEFRKRIICGDFKPAQALNESHLIETLGFGRTPTREALMRLAKEGFLEWTPRRAPTVSSATPERVQKVYEARLAMERSIMPYAISRITDEEIASLTETWVDIGEKGERDEVYEATNVDYLFHLQIAKATGNPFMVDNAVNIYNASLPIWYRTQVLLGVRESLDEHQELIKAIASRDTAKALDAVSGHVHLSYAKQLRMFQFSLEPEAGYTMLSPETLDSRAMLDA